MTITFVYCFLSINSEKD